MKRINLWVRLAGLLCIGVVLGVYQQVAVARAAVVAENEEQIAGVEEYNKQIQKQMAEDLAAAGEAIAEAERGEYKDGTYQGEGRGYGGLIKVQVFVEGGWIQEVEVMDHSTEDLAYYTRAESLIGDMIDQQLVQVDTITGATFSSRGIIAAVEDALKVAK